MKENEINGLADLRRRKEELRLEMKVTRMGLFHSLRQTGREARRAFITGVLVPLGIGSLASLIFSKQPDDGKKPEWLLFAEQALHTVGQFFEGPETENGQPEKDDKGL
ncbi:MAG: hypothetical protein KDD06_27945 [Phaeodactylibacter sp.]|nr:hypothetical protein [Phaeodactylibacter sp.]MCB9289769.1 hypothetical protein [Lewinellaceae bacterium]